jgi:Xaa-Pro aminopeptidase
MHTDIQRSAEVNVAALRKVKPLLRVGMSEREIAALVKRALLGEGAEKLAFPVIAALTSHAAEPHHKPTDRRARPGDLLVLDMGGVVGGMRSDMTRTFFFGEPRPQHRHWYELVLQAQERGFRAVREGETGEAVDRVARDFLHRHGHGKYFIHSLGHGVGRAIHQRPWISPRKGANVLRSGDAIAIEPGVYLKGRGGVRIEDTCEVLPTGSRWLVPMQRHISRMVLPVD